MQRRRSLLPWLILGPGLLWLLIFFAIPLGQQLIVSLMSGDPDGNECCGPSESSKPSSVAAACSSKLN